MRLTVEALLAFDPTRWTLVADRLGLVTRGTREVGALLDEVAARMGPAWNDEIGDLIAASCRSRAAATGEEADVLPALAETLYDGARAMTACADEMRAIAAPVRSADTGLPEPQAAARQAAHADALRAVTASILQRATVIDRRIAALLAEAVGEPAPVADLGPLDLTVEGLSVAADLTTQGATGLDAWVATLMSLARRDPGVIRDRLSWDEAARTYRVTLLPAGAGRVEVAVDPGRLPEFPYNAMTQEADFVAVYTQALRGYLPEGAHVDAAVAGRLLLGVDVEERQAARVPFAEVVERAASHAMVVSVHPPGGGEATAWSVAGLAPDGRLELHHPYGPGFPSHVMALDDAGYADAVRGVVILPHSGEGQR